jgi:PAS domain S-box-containing protein
MKYLQYLTSVHSIHRIVLITICSILIDEIFSTWLLHFLPPMQWLSEAVLDALMLLVTITPTIYLLVLRPLTHFVVKIEEEKNKLQKSELRYSQSEQMLNIVLDNFPGSVFWKDKELKYLGCNRPFAKLAGFDHSSEIIGKTEFDLRWDAVEAEKFRAADVEVMNSGKEKLHFVESMVNKNESVLWFEKSKIPLRDADGTTIGLLGVSLDITERIKGEEELRETNDYLQNLFQYANAPIITWDPSLVITRFNNAFVELSGYPAGEVVGKNIEMLFAKDKVRSSMALINEAISGERWKTVEIEIQQKDGGARTVLWNSANILSKDGSTVVSTIAQGHDITDRKKAEMALQESNEMLSSLMKHSPVYIFVKEVSPVESSVLNVSQNFHEVTGVPVPKMVGKTMRELFPAEFAEKIIADDWNSFSKGTVLRVEEELNGRFYSTIKFPFIQGGRNILGGFTIDITEERKALVYAEETLKKLQESENELRQKNTELEQFTYTVSHDLKSPLITIKGYSGGLLRDLSNGRHDRFDSDLRRIAVAADKMTLLLENLLELSRIGRIVNPPSEISLNELTHDVLSLLSGPIAKCNATIIVQPDLPVVTADRTRLHEVLQNLVENALKFTCGRPEPRIEIGMRRNGSVEPIIFVRDNGKGIDPRYHETVFGLFNKLDVSSDGTGIGLALVRRIIDVHGGRTWVESEGIDHGATFCFTLQSNNHL